MRHHRNGHEFGIEMLPFAGLVYPLRTTRRPFLLRARWGALTGRQRHRLLLPTPCPLAPLILAFSSVLLSARGPKRTVESHSHHQQRRQQLCATNITITFMAITIHTTPRLSTTILTSHKRWDPGVDVHLPGAASAVAGNCPIPIKAVQNGARTTYKLRVFAQVLLVYPLRLKVPSCCLWGVGYDSSRRGFGLISGPWPCRGLGIDGGKRGPSHRDL
ncbi:hypothetical protein J3F83DRAFT_750210 [Trichoderma novae-zelandiae]